MTVVCIKDATAATATPATTLTTITNLSDNRLDYGCDKCLMVGRKTTIKK